ncbi:recombinase family protein [Spirosoma migulaei]
MKPAIAYYRVSTDRQGKSGLGLEAQEEAVRLFEQQHGYLVIARFIEVESGKKNKRVELLAALDLCRKKKATLIIAKLDRLGRNVAFISNLMESQVEFKAVDNPEASKLLLHMLAAFAEHEREQISVRTKDALQAAKRRGTVLGVSSAIRAKENKEAADKFAEDMRPTIQDMRQSGFTTIRAIRDELNRQGVPTYRNNGQNWHNQGVHALLKRIGQAPT